MEAVFPPNGSILSRLWKHANQTLFASRSDFIWIANRLYLQTIHTLGAKPLISRRIIKNWTL
jgi:hypothetical protein